jgi:hypothetical protein
MSIRREYNTIHVPHIVQPKFRNFDASFESQTRTVESVEPEAMQRPSGENATDRTLPMRLRKKGKKTSSPEVISQILTVLSEEPEMNSGCCLVSSRVTPDQIYPLRGPHL